MLTGAWVAVIARTTAVTATALQAILRHWVVIIGEAAVVPATSADRYAIDGKSVATNQPDGRSAMSAGGAARLSQSVSHSITSPPVMPAPTTSSVAARVRRMNSHTTVITGTIRIVSCATPTSR